MSALPDTQPGIVILTPAGPIRPRLRSIAAPVGEDSSVAGLWVALAVSGVPTVLLVLMAARYGVSHLWVRALAALTVTLTVAMLLRDLRYGLALFIVAAGLSPKLPGLYDNLRVEDFVFTLVFGIWCLKALQRGRFPTVQCPFVTPFLLLTLMSAISTVWGCSLGMVPDLKYSLFLQAKRIEYFLIFWVVVTSVRSEKWLRALTVLFVVSGALAALYGMTQARDDGYITVADKRVLGPEGENYNTLSGYLVVCIGMGLAAIAEFRQKQTRNLMILCTGVAGAGLLMSFSREGYIMLVGSLLVFGITRHRWLLLGALVALVMAFTMAAPVRDHVHDTVQKVRGARTDDRGSNSLSARYDAWEWRWKQFFLKQPVIGNGVGSVALSVDNEYLMRACEVGATGFAVFCWWLFGIGRLVRQSMRFSSGLTQCLATGLAAGFVGLLIQGLVAASFTTIRTMEPFWFLLGLLCAGALLRSGNSDTNSRPAFGAAAQPGLARPAA